MVVGAWCLALGAWCLVVGAWCLVIGVWCLAIGVWCVGVLVRWCVGACLMAQTKTGARVVSVLWKCSGARF